VKLPANWTNPVLHQTRSALRASRHSALKPDPSYDIDGDGFVSPQDYQLATKWEPTRSSKLTGDARSSALKEEYQSMSGVLRDDEVGGNKRARAIINGLSGPPELNDTWRHYHLREANMTITNLKNKSSQQAIECMTMPEARAPLGGPSGRAMTRGLMLERRRENFQLENYTAAEKFKRDIA